jgi:hypothetical protein
LYSEEIKLQIRKGIQRIGEFAQIELCKARIEPSKLYAQGNVREKRLLVGFFEGLRTV